MRYMVMVNDYQLSTVQNPFDIPRHWLVHRDSYQFPIIIPISDQAGSIIPYVQHITQGFCWTLLPLMFNSDTGHQNPLGVELPDFQDPDTRMVAACGGIFP